MKSLIAFVKRRPVATFFVLAFALSWWPSILNAVLGDFLPILAAGPFLAALIVAGIAEGKSGVKDIVRRIVRWRVGVRWYAVALLLPLAVMGSAAVVNILLGAPIPAAAQFARWPTLLTVFATRLLIPLSGPWEEPGWRGYALPRLLAGRSAVAASVLLGVIVAAWHVPLVLIGDVDVFGLLNTVTATILIVWLFKHTNGSVLLIMLFHAMNNTVNVFFNPMFTGASASHLSLIHMLLDVVIVIVVILVAGPNLGRQPSAAPGESARTAQPLARENPAQ